MRTAKETKEEKLTMFSDWILSSKLSGGRSSVVGLEDGTSDDLAGLELVKNSLGVVLSNKAIDRQY